jgi:hypothetical protein
MVARLSAIHPGHFLPPGRFLVLISVRGSVNPRDIMRLEGLGKLKKSTSSGTQTGNLPACSIVPQPTMLLHAPWQGRLRTILYKEIRKGGRSGRHWVQPKCDNGMRDWGLKQQLWLERTRNVNKALGETTELEVIMLAAMSSCKIWKMSVKTLWRSRPPTKWKKRLPRAGMSATLRNSECTDPHRRNGSTLVGYTRWTPSRREQCAM